MNWEYVNQYRFETLGQVSTKPLPRWDGRDDFARRCNPRIDDGEYYYGPITDSDKEED